MDQTSGISAAQWLENADAVEIANVIYLCYTSKKLRRGNAKKP
jgi:16S rRNA C1402 N4-methylase RsmH